MADEREVAMPGVTTGSSASGSAVSGQAVVEVEERGQFDLPTGW